MKYDEGVLFIQEIFNEVFVSLEEKPLFDNEIFHINQELHFEHFIQLKLIKKNTCRVLIEISRTELRIDIDRADEVFNMSINYIKNNREEVIKIIEMIFTSTIMVQYCGKYITNLYFIKNDSVETYRYASTLLPIRFSRYCEEKVYLPIFSS